MHVLPELTIYGEVPLKAVSVPSTPPPSNTPSALIWARLLFGPAPPGRVQAGLGFAYGFVQGAAPFGTLAPSPAPGDRMFTRFQGLGQVAGGSLDIAIGGGMEGTGTGACSTGVLCLAGAPVIALGVALQASGAGAITSGVGLTVSSTTMASTGSGSGGAPIPRRTEPRIEDGNKDEGWTHIESRHVTGTHPDGAGDLFAPGTTREQLSQAAKDVVAKGTRLSNPSRTVQSFEDKVKVNGQRDRVRVVVDSSDNNRVITMFPVRSE